MYTKTLTFMMKPDEKAALEALADEDSASQAAVLRRLIRNFAQQRGVWPSADGQRASVKGEPWWKSKEDGYCVHCHSLVSWREMHQCEQCHDLVCHECIRIGPNAEFYCVPCAGLEECRD
jgi:hypothetical protein